MGKALTAVAVVLGLCFTVFGGIVYVTRDEDTVAVDSALSERFARAVVEADEDGEVVDLRAVLPFDFDQVLIFEPGQPRAAVSRELGFEFTGELLYTAESTHLLVFTNQGRFVRFIDYRGRGRFEGLQEPFARLTANDAAFRVEDGVITPA